MPHLITPSDWLLQVSKVYMAEKLDLSATYDTHCGYNLQIQFLWSCCRSLSLTRQPFPSAVSPPSTALHSATKDITPRAVRLVPCVFAHGRQVSPSGLTHSNYIIIIIIIMCVELVYSCRILIRLPFRTGQTGKRRWWSMSGGQSQVAVFSAGIKIQSQSSVEWKFGQRAFCTSSTQQDNFVASANGWPCRRRRSTRSFDHIPSHEEICNHSTFFVRGCHFTYLDICK